MLRATWVAWVGVLASGCLRAELVPCGDQLCPSESVCVADRCVTQAQVDACTGLDEGASCTTPSGMGRCAGSVCVATGCGNGVVELEEMCDDGNATSGDGCRADCQKVERCGDAVLDVGEGCDDGNENAADGCDACTPTSWQATALIGGGTQATETGMYPESVALDNAGNLYIADAENYRVWRVDPTGVITSIAGIGVSDTTGDGGPATSAALENPSAVAVDGVGNVYIANGFAPIRKVDPEGIITTLPGIPAARDVTVDGLGGVYYADQFRVMRIDVDGTVVAFAGDGTSGASGDGGPATSAKFTNISAITFDSAGSLFISDTGTHTIRKVAPTGIITTIAGNGTPGFSGDGGPATSAQLYFPMGVASDGAGAVWIADNSNRRVRKVAPDGTITTIGGGGTVHAVGVPATSVAISNPKDIVRAPDGSVFVTESPYYKVRRIDPEGLIHTAAGTTTPRTVGDGGSATSAKLEEPRGVAVDAQGNVYVADAQGCRIRRVSPDGLITTVAGTGEEATGAAPGVATELALARPEGVLVDPAGGFYVADALNNRVCHVDDSGMLTTIAGTGTAGYSGDGGQALNAQLRRPSAIDFDPQGRLVITDYSNNVIRRIETDGTIVTIAGTGVNGGTTGYGDGGLATAARLSTPHNVAFDAAGDMYIADFAAHRIRKVTMSTGIITTVAGNGVGARSGDGGLATNASLYLPNDVAIDQAGNLIIADSFNSRIRRVDKTTNVITTIAGGDGELGDGGPALEADMSPTGLAFDAQGNLYVADDNNELVRKITPGGTITSIAGHVDPDGAGPVAQAQLADPRALVYVGDETVFAGGASGTIERLRDGRLEVVAGRYGQWESVGDLARFRDFYFGDVGGVAYDPGAGRIYLSETTAHRVQVVTMVDPTNPHTWTIAPLVNAAGTEGFSDGTAATAGLRSPAGLLLDAAANKLYIADAGNQAVRALDLTSNAVSTIAGTGAVRGMYGDGAAATAALLYEPHAVARCANGDLFIADTGNHRVRRVATTGVITTVLGDGVPASSGEGTPASTFPVDAPLGLACDAIGNLYVTSSETVRLLPADDAGVVDGTGPVFTIYGAAPRDTFPASVTRCLSGIVVVDATHVQVTDSCTGILVELARVAK